MTEFKISGGSLVGEFPSEPGPPGPPGGGGISEAPQDDKVYGRKNANWAEVPVGQSTGAAAFGLNVRDYGAKGDGINDDAPAFEKTFLEGAKRQSGQLSLGLIKIPQGRYKFSRAVNMEIAGERYAVNVQGETHNAWDGGGGSVIIAPWDDYAFKAVAMDPMQWVDMNAAAVANGWNDGTWEHLHVIGYGGWFLQSCQPTFRNLSFETWRAIVIPQCWATPTFENIVLRGRNDMGLPITGDLEKGQVGIFVFSMPAGRMSCIESQGYLSGTAVALAGGQWTLQNFHLETSRCGVLLGIAPKHADGHGGQNYQTQCRVAQMGFEGCLISILAYNCGMSSFENIHIQGHEVALPEDPAGFAFAGLFLNNVNNCKIESVICQSGFTQGPIVGQYATPPHRPQGEVDLIEGTVIFPNEAAVPAAGLGVNKAVNRRNNLDAWFPLDKNYPAGSQTLKLLRGRSVQMPVFLIELKQGTQARAPWGGGIAEGTTVTRVSGDAIELSQPTVGPCSQVRFSDASGNVLGEYDYRYPYWGPGSEGTIPGNLVPI